MRFYFKERGEPVSTRCIRVSSAATTLDVIEALISESCCFAQLIINCLFAEKFHPDMKMMLSDQGECRPQADCKIKQCLSVSCMKIFVNVMLNTQAIS